jgi:hypothetical protein
VLHALESCRDCFIAAGLAAEAQAVTYDDWKTTPADEDILAQCQGCSEGEAVGARNGRPLCNECISNEDAARDSLRADMAEAREFDQCP